MGKLSKDRRDIFYRKAKEKGYRSRSSFKLLQINEKFKILDGVYNAVDLCAAPGGWSQVLSDCLPESAKIAAVDLQQISPINKVTMLREDITDCENTPRKILNVFEGEKADIVLSDGAPDVSGMDDVDYFIQNQLIISSLRIALLLLKRGGTFVSKVFRGRDIDRLVTSCSSCFESVSVVKPRASRNSSVESFLLCQEFKADSDLHLVFPVFPGLQSPETASGFSVERENVVDISREVKKLNAFCSFYSCDDASGDDADGNYALVLNRNDESLKEHNVGEKKYSFKSPVQPPIDPSYEEYIQRRNEIQCLWHALCFVTRLLTPFAGSSIAAHLVGFSESFLLAFSVPFYRCGCV